MGNAFYRCSNPVCDNVLRRSDVCIDLKTDRVFCYNCANNLTRLRERPPTTGRVYARNRRRSETIQGEILTSTGQRMTLERVTDDCPESDNRY